MCHCRRPPNYCAVTVADSASKRFDMHAAKHLQVTSVRTCSPDGQLLPAIANTIIHNGEFGLPEEGLPDEVFSIDPVQGASGIATVKVLGHNVGASPSQV